MTDDLETICFFVNKRHTEELMREVVSLFNVNMDSQVFKQGISDGMVCGFLIFRLILKSQYGKKEQR